MDQEVTPHRPVKIMAVFCVFDPLRAALWPTQFWFVVVGRVTASPDMVTLFSIFGDLGRRSKRSASASSRRMLQTHATMEPTPRFYQVLDKRSSRLDIAQKLSRRKNVYVSQGNMKKIRRYILVIRTMLLGRGITVVMAAVD